MLFRAFTLLSKFVTPMTQEDTLQRFVFTNAPIRGEIVHLEKSYQTILQRHPYPSTVQFLLGQALAASALLSATLKSYNALTLQIESDGPISLIVAQSKPDFRLRGLATWEGEIDAQPEKALGTGQLGITITPEKGERYQGVVKLEQGSLSLSLEKYFAQSEQLPTCILLTANTSKVAGLFLQAIPGDQEQETHLLFEEAATLAKTLRTDELLELPNELLLHRLFHEHDLQLFETEPVGFHCDCTTQRMENAILMLDEKDVTELLSIYKAITVTCEFCNHHHDFSPQEVAAIRQPDSPPSQEQKH